MKKKILSMFLACSCMLSLAAPAMAVDEVKPAVSFNNTESGNRYGGFQGSWSEGFNAHIVKVDDGYLRVENMNDYKLPDPRHQDIVLVEHYNENFQLTDVDKIPFELDYYIAFYEGEDNYYILFSQSNYKEDNSVEVIRVVKYDKDWNRLNSASVYGSNTIGYDGITTADMAEADGTLLVHTNHTMYKSRDGLNHQANLRLDIDIDSMELLRTAAGISTSNSGYVSHSFNQLVDVAADGAVYSADHGDGFPRAMVLFSFPSNAIVAMPDNIVHALEFPGIAGDNVTGAQMGGLEASSSHVIMAGTSRPQDGTSGPYNIFLSTTDRDNFTESGTKFTWVTSYDESDNGLFATNPYLLEAEKDEFILMWTEVRFPEDPTLCWTTLDNEGTQIDKIHRIAGELSDARPVFNDDGDLVWFMSCYKVPDFYTLDLATDTLTKTPATTYRGEFTNEPTSWAKAEIELAEASGLITKSNRDNFQANITRAQFAELVVNFLEDIMFQPLRIDESIYFSDTTDTSVLKAASAGVVQGVGNNKFNPNASITREEIATMLNRALDFNYDNGGSDLAPLAGNLYGYSDAYLLSSWSRNAVGRLAANGIMKGRTTTMLDPKGTTDVQSGIILVYRLHDACMKINEMPLEIPMA